uniref:Radical SAM domain protein n=1 Tax=Sphingobacterium sp. (strain 21) TaxID=743722 RepID=F4C9X7_SPHS2
MKYSQFNNLIFYKEGKYLLYNALTNNFMIIQELLRDLLLAAKAEYNIEGLADIHPTFYRKLIDDGFIVRAEVDEVAKVRKIREEVDLMNKDEFILTINPTMNCNFNCWYCYESHIKDSKMEDITIDHVKDFIRNVVSERPSLKYFSIAWFGGEPLLQYRRVVKPIQEFCKYFLSEHGIKFSASFTTNGFLINKEMIKLFRETNASSFQITLDGNRVLHNAVRFVNSKKGSYDEIIQNILALCRAGFFVALRINYTKTNLEGIEDIMEDIKGLEDIYRKNLEIAFRKVWQENDRHLGERVRQATNFFRTAGFKVISGGSPDNVRNSCYADKNNHATINYNGEVFKCTARNFSSEAKEGVLTSSGTIVWNEKYYDRLSVKFKNKPCLTCSILPICNGGCSQKALENIDKDYCVFNFNESAKQEVILHKLLDANVQL